MNQFEFLKYELTPNEKYLGIATVKLYGKIILRYKIVPNKDGSGYFAAAASYKMPSLPGAPDKYSEAFMLDSNFEKEELMNLIHDNIRKYNAPQPSVFPASQNYQAPKNNQYYHQQPIQSQPMQPDLFPNDYQPF